MHGLQVDHFLLIIHEHDLAFAALLQFRCLEWLRGQGPYFLLLSTFYSHSTRCRPPASFLHLGVGELNPLGVLEHGQHLIHQVILLGDLLRPAQPDVRRRNGHLSEVSGPGILSQGP